MVNLVIIIDNAKRELVNKVMTNYFGKGQLERYYGMDQEAISKLPLDMQVSICKSILNSIKEASRLKTEMLKNQAKIDAKEIITKTRELKKLEKLAKKNKADNYQLDKINYLKDEIKGIQGELGFIYITSLKNAKNLSRDAKANGYNSNEEYANQVVKKYYESNGIELKPYHESLKRVLYYNKEQLVNGIPKSTEKQNEEMSKGNLNEREKKEIEKILGDAIKNIERYKNKAEDHATEKPKEQETDQNNIINLEQEAKRYTELNTEEKAKAL